MRTHEQFAYGAILDYWPRWREVRDKVELARTSRRRRHSGRALSMLTAFATLYTKR